MAVRATPVFETLSDVQWFFLDTLIAAGFDTVLVEVGEEEEEEKVIRPKTAKASRRRATPPSRPKTAGAPRRRPLWRV